MFAIPFATRKRTATAAPPHSTIRLFLLVLACTLGLRRTSEFLGAVLALFACTNVSTGPAFPPRRLPLLPTVG